MNKSMSLLVVIIVAGLIGACSRPFAVANRTGSNSGLSDVSIKFKNDLNPELRKHLTHYHFSITPDDERCKREKMGTAISEQDKEWTVGQDLVIKAPALARNCTYLIKLAFGKMNETKQFVTLFSNYVNKAGDLITTSAENMIVPITVELTDEGRKLGLEKFAESIPSSLETSLEASVIFAAALKLDGEYQVICVSDGSATPKFISRTVKIAGEVISVSEKLYAAADCSDSNLISEEKGEAKFQVGASVKTTVANANELNLLSVTKKSFKAGEKFSGTWCGKSDWTRNAVNNILADTSLPCQTGIAGVAPFDLVALKDAKLSFGARVNGKDGSSAQTRATELAAAALPKKS